MFQNISSESLMRFKHSLANSLQNELAVTAPVDTGFLRNSISVKVKGDELVVHMPEYALFVEYGTDPHVIVPKDKKSLRWKSGGKTFFAKKVFHPGTRPIPFIRNTFYHKFSRLVAEAAERHLSGVVVEVDVSDHDY